MSEIRVGICDCNPHYHGQLVGKKIYFPDVGRECRTIFKLAECLVPRSYEREALLAFRCHFFLDFHTGASGVAHVTVERNDLVHNRVRDCWLLYKGGFYVGRWARNFRQGIQRWDNEAPPPPEAVVGGVRRLLANMDEPKLESWLSIMTPPGWYAVLR